MEKNERRAKTLVEILDPSKLYDLSKQIEKILSNEGMGGLEILSKFEKIRHKIVSSLIIYIQNCEKLGLVPKFRLKEKNEYLVGRSHPEYPNLNEKFKKRFLSHDFIKSAIEDLNGRAFEFFSAYTLSLCGFEEITVTPGAREGGGDVCGIFKISSGSRSGLFDDPNFYIRVIVQAKKGDVSSPAVELFSEQVGRLRHACQTGDLSLSRMAPRLPESFTQFKYPQTPIVPLLFTAGRPTGLNLFTDISKTEGAVKTAKDSGIILRYVGQLITDFVYLAEKWFNESGRFEKELFLEKFLEMANYAGRRENVEKNIFAQPPFI